MLELVDLDVRLPKGADTSDVEAHLARLQRAIREAGLPVAVVLEGWDCAGKGAALSRLLQPLDPRGYKVLNVGPASGREKMFPPMRRFWLLLPNDGIMAFYNHSWYRQTLEDGADAGTDAAHLRPAFEGIRVFERQLTDDGLVLIKFFLHISKKEQARRFKALSKDPAFAWRVGKAERRRHKRYNKYFAAVENMLEETSTACAPWIMVPATDERYAALTIMENMAGALETALNRPRAASVAPVTPVRRTSPLEQVDLGQVLAKAEYNKQLPDLQQRLRRLQHLCYRRRIPVAIVYEGWDAAGKGGNIRRLIRELDPRGYEVVPFAAPAGEERTHHYLWRFWRALPKSGHIHIFDRSWYGRVMVERVENFATPEEWSRAYREINEFENALAEYGTIIIKIWLHISKEEQLARFEARQTTPGKEWKITDEDWRNREKWDAYYDAVSEMIERTSTVQAPWTIVEANNKRHARITVLKEVAQRIEAALKDD
ncbi:MAG: polyphosphate:AMP phosphotransferase [Candidatus Hydrogenedentes bacterium]|nr:polyphosphate:AMP phosphotransferase [Candidatus Hydrogenedentota bacterium]